MSRKDRSKERVRVVHNGTMLEQHEEFWFTDGNLVLVARNTAFQIYRGLLAVQSRVFEDMFTSACSSTDELLDGCPIIHLSDSPEDLAYLLHVLLPTSRKIFHLRQGEPRIEFEEVFAVVTLAHKYGIEDIEAQALSFLKDTGYFSTKCDRFLSPDTTKLSIEPVKMIGAVILARLTNTPSMLPAALYFCCRLGGDLLDGWARTDGTTWHLAQEDIKHCVNARASVTQVVWRTFRIIFDDDKLSPSCARPDQCRAGLHLLCAAIMDCELAEPRPTFWDWSDRLSNGQKDGQFCERCHAMLQDRNRVVLRTVWAWLPGIFGLPRVEGWPTT